LNVLIAGVSTRAAAESAARAGFAVTAIDAFGDLDQHPSVRAHALRDGFSASAAARLAQTIACDAVAYVSNFENHPGAVSRLAAGRSLWGNAGEVLARVRDPMLLTRALRRRGHPAPDVWLEPGMPDVDSGRDRAWILKPRASGGGRKIRLWRAGSPLPRGCYLQEFVDGAPGSVVFAAAGGRAVTLGVCRQLIGEAPFGASGYQYCGNILVAAGEDDRVVGSARALAETVCAEFGLVGVNGIDFVAKDGVPHAIEVNPRWCASMELVERAYGLSVFGAHAAACRDGALPEFDVARARRGLRAVGKAIVYARNDVTVANTREWLKDSDLRDVPVPGARIAAGGPVCTVMAAGADAEQCHARLVQRAQRVYGAL
jgi:uncharacterized protein